MRHNGFRRFIQAQQLPANWLIAHATTADLPDPHDRVVFFGEAHGVNLDQSSIVTARVSLRVLGVFQGRGGALRSTPSAFRHAYFSSEQTPVTVVRWFSVMTISTGFCQTRSVIASVPIS